MLTNFMVSRKLERRTNASLNRVDYFYIYSLVNRLCFGLAFIPARYRIDQKFKNYINPFSQYFLTFGLNYYKVSLFTTKIITLILKFVSYCQFQKLLNRLRSTFKKQKKIDFPQQVYVAFVEIPCAIIFFTLIQKCSQFSPRYENCSPIEYE